MYFRKPLRRGGVLRRGARLRPADGVARAPGKGRNLRKKRLRNQRRSAENESENAQKARPEMDKKWGSDLTPNLGVRPLAARRLFVTGFRPDPHFGGQALVKFGAFAGRVFPDP